MTPTKILATLLATIPASLVLLPASVAAQPKPCHAEFDGNVFKDNVSMGGPNFTNCIKTTAKASMVVFAVQMFTGEKTGTSTVGIWSHDAAKDEPKQELARGSWQMVTTNSWQGQNLNKPVPIAKGTTFWVSWIPVNGSQASVENSGRTLPNIQTYKWSRTNSAPWNGPFKGHQWKFRLWCAPLGTAGITVIGKGCSDGFGKIGQHFTAQKPSVGNQSFNLEGGDLPPSAAALLILGLNKNFQSIDLTPAGAPTCFLHTDSVVELFLKTTSGTASKSDGKLNVPAPIPNNASLKGFFLRSQVAVADANSRRALKVIFTNGLGITIQ